MQTTEHGRRNEHHPVDAQGHDEPVGDPASADASQRRAEGDEGEDPFAFLFGVEVVGEPPELGHDEDVEDADPDEKEDAHQADVHSEKVESVKKEEVRR